MRQRQIVGVIVEINSGDENECISGAGFDEIFVESLDNNVPYKSCLNNKHFRFG